MFQAVQTREQYAIAIAGLKGNKLGSLISVVPDKHALPDIKCFSVFTSRSGRATSGYGGPGVP